MFEIVNVKKLNNRSANVTFKVNGIVKHMTIAENEIAALQRTAAEITRHFPTLDQAQTGTTEDIEKVFM